MDAFVRISALSNIFFSACTLFFSLEDVKSVKNIIIYLKRAWYLGMADTGA